MTGVAQTHGLTVNGQDSPARTAYYGARRRCTDPRHTRSFKNYGARGIRFLFESVEQWLAELGPRPSPNHSVDRVNSDGHYEPGNVRWATRTEQNKGAWIRRRAA